jgi:hypothetical protein
VKATVTSLAKQPSGWEVRILKTVSACSLTSSLFIQFETRVQPRGSPAMSSRAESRDIAFGVESGNARVTRTLLPTSQRFRPVVKTAVTSPMEREMQVRILPRGTILAWLNWQSA